MPQTSVNMIAGDDARASDVNRLVADLAEIYAGGPGVPVGGGILWWSDNTVPLNYKVCDGTVINDVLSPLNGLTVPNMTDRFARGVANSNVRTTPVSGGEDAVTLTVNEMPVHSHGHNNPQHNHSVNDPGHSHTLNGRNSAPGNSDGNGVEWSAIFDVGRGGGINSSGTGISLNPSVISLVISNAGGGASHNNIPAYRGWVYIMRIK